MSQQHAFQPSTGLARRRRLRIARRAQRHPGVAPTAAIGGKRLSVREWIAQLAFAALTPIRPTPPPRCDHRHIEEATGQAKGRTATVVYEPCNGRLQKTPTRHEEPQQWACRKCGRTYQQIGRTSGIERTA